MGIVNTWRASLAEDRAQRAAYWALVVLLPLAYWVLALRHSGPTYLGDEIGYLTKAAVMAGYSADMATDWHAGYALFLAPVFRIVESPRAVWYGITVVNAGLWMVALVLLFAWLRTVRPDQRFWGLWLAVGFAGVYPAWATFSGYALATNGFVVVFIASLAALSRAITARDPAWWWLFFAFLVGFSFWVHPTGAVVAIASVVAVAAGCWWRRRWWPLPVHIGIVCGLIASYAGVVDPWLAARMTAPGFEPGGHYPAVTAIAGRLFDPPLIGAALMIMAGQLAYLLVASLGAVGYALDSLGRAIAAVIRGDWDPNAANGVAAISGVFCILSVFGIAALGGLSLAGDGLSESLGPDNWIYGRYVEGVVLPLLALGVVAAWRWRTRLTTSALLGLAAVAFSLYPAADLDGTIDRLQIPGFWPMLIGADLGFVLWLSAGAIGVGMVALIGKRSLPWLALPLFAGCLVFQSQWHVQRFDARSRPSPLVTAIRANVPAGSCIGFDPRLPKAASYRQQVKRRMYAFYFYDYDFRRMLPESWLRSCDGPYLTFHGRQAAGDGLRAVARERRDGVVWISRVDQAGALDVSASALSGGLVYWDVAGEHPCLARGCWHRGAEELTDYSPNGTLVDGMLRSNGRQGYLLRGPWQPLAAGDYVLELEGTGLAARGAQLRLVGHRNGHRTVEQFRLDRIGGKASGIVRLPFFLKQDAQALAIHILVPAGREVGLASYRVREADAVVMPDSPTAPVSSDRRQ